MHANRGNSKVFWSFEITAVLLCLCTTLPAAAIPEPGIPAAGRTDPIPAASDETAIPREVLLAMDRAEIGAGFKDISDDALFSLHQAIERFFDATGAKQRKEAIAALIKTGVDANVIGRLTRVRMRWPALAGGIYYVNEKRGPFDVRYFLGVPAAYDRTKRWPMVVKLADLNPLLVQPPPDADQVTEIYHGWINAELGKHPDAIVLMPLVDLHDFFGPSYTGMNCVMQPIFHAADRVNIDPARLYLFGHSTGASSAWNLALHEPTYFASFAALAGSAGQDWQRVRLENLRNILPVVWADAKDKVVKPESARGLVAALEKLKLPVDYVETRGLGHQPSDAVVEERYQKMRDRKRQIDPSWVTMESDRPDVIFNRNEWIQLWQESDTGKESHIPFRRTAGHITVYENSAKIDARREANTVYLTLRNVESMRIYLNDRMFNLDQPIKVIINKRKTIDRRAHSDIAQMMNDQLFLGRGWRYYSAFLDVDLTAPATTNPATAPTTRSGKITVGAG